MVSRSGLRNPYAIFARSRFGSCTSRTPISVNTCRQQPTCTTGDFCDILAWTFRFLTRIASPRSSPYQSQISNISNPTTHPHPHRILGPGGACNMDNLKLQDYRSFVVRLCARAYSHCLEISLLYGVEFTVDDHQHVLSALNRIIRTTDPSKIIDLPDSDLVSSVMDLVQTLEDAAASDLDPIQNDMLEADAIGFDASVQLTYAQLREMRERDLGTDESPVEAVASMLRDIGRA